MDRPVHILASPLRFALTPLGLCTVARPNSRVRDAPRHPAMTSSSADLTRASVLAPFSDDDFAHSDADDFEEPSDTDVLIEPPVVSDTEK